MWERRPREIPAATDQTVDSDSDIELVAAPDHDYSVSGTTGVMTYELQVENETLRRQVELLQREVEGLQLRVRFGLQRFAGSDDEIRFYTR